MIKQLFTQTIFMIRKQPLLSALSIGGTALAICLIMLLVMFRQVRLVPYAPESNKDRMLYVPYVSITQKDHPEYSSNGPLGLQTATECFGKLQTPEAVTLYIMPISMVATGPGNHSVKVAVKQTDADFFKVFDFRFLSGSPYNEEEAASGVAKAVITRTTARKLFGEENVVGRNLEINYQTFRVAAVVEDVSALADAAAGEIWVPYNCMDYVRNGLGKTDLRGYMQVAILAHSAADFPAIRQEVDRLVEIYNASVAPQVVFFRGQPDTKAVAILRKYANLEPDVSEARRNQWMIYLILLLVPAINLSAMTHSRLQQRVEEIGIRRAFGSTRKELFLHVLVENLLLTLLGGVIGLLLCMAVSFFWGAFLFTNTLLSYSAIPILIDPMALFHFSTFGWALLFCLLMNLFTAGYPAWKASRTQIVNALSGKTENM